MASTFVGQSCQILGTGVTLQYAARYLFRESELTKRLRAILALATFFNVAGTLCCFYSVVHWGTLQERDAVSLA